MTARDEAIAAMAEARSTKRRDTLLVDLLDAIPADVLARLAIERGGLVAAGAGRNGLLYRLKGTDQ